MIFASDLDRTLIYSKRAIEELGMPEAAGLIPVEKKDGNWVAFMTEAAFSSLKELSRTSLFIPVTTRTTEQFKRIVLFNDEISIKYAITTNGAVVLQHGEPLKEWSDYISGLIEAESISQEQLQSLLDREGFRFQGKLKQVEDLFFYYILDHRPLDHEKAIIQDIVQTYGWRISLQGKKLYFIPTAISKGAALEFICRREGIEAFAGAGDSILDWDFLQNCHYRFVPSHGELKDAAGTTGLTFTKKVGIEAGEEILQQSLKILSKKSQTFSKKAIENKSIQTAK